MAKSPVYSVLLLTVCVLACAMAAAHPQMEEDKLLWAKFQADHSRVYASAAEEAHRFAVFQSNLRKAEKLNSDPTTRAHYGVTKFSDLTLEEFKSTYLRLSPAPHGRWLRRLPQVDLSSAKHQDIDWEDQDGNPKKIVAVSDVEDQGQCGSCWAFSAVEALEGCAMIHRMDNVLLQASPQQVVDCCTAGESKGCSGGDPSACLEWATHQNIATDKSYPYNGWQSKCKNTTTHIGVKAEECHFVTVPAKNETALEMALYLSPVSISIAADVLQTYSEGIIGGADCAGGEVDHAVLLVALQDKGTVYNIKNSWGDWGEGGYFRMTTDVNCLDVTTQGAALAVPSDN